jgi:hypothetical protein
MILRLIKSERPFMFFTFFSALFFLHDLYLSVPLCETFMMTGLVPRIPTAVIIVGLSILSAISFACGLILDTVTRGRRELRRLVYLQYPAPAFSNE